MCKRKGGNDILLMNISALLNIETAPFEQLTREFPQRGVFMVFFVEDLHVLL